MEQAWKQSSVALGFQGVLISICSSETRGIKRLLEDPKKGLCRRKSHFQISGFVSLSYSSITLTSVIFGTIQQVTPCYMMDSERSAGLWASVLPPNPSSYHCFISFSLLLFCCTQRGKGGACNTAAVPLTASCCTAFWERQTDSRETTICIFVSWLKRQNDWKPVCVCVLRAATLVLQLRDLQDEDMTCCLPFTLIGQRPRRRRGVSAADHVSSWLGQCV